MVDLSRISKRSQQPYSRRPEGSGRIADPTDFTDRDQPSYVGEMDDPAVPMYV